MKADVLVLLYWTMLQVGYFNKKLVDASYGGCSGGAVTLKPFLKERKKRRKREEDEPLLGPLARPARSAPC